MKAVCSGLNLHSVWDVELQNGFRKKLDESANSDRYIAVLVESGEGMIGINNEYKQGLKVRRNDLFISKINELAYYKAMDENWKIWWFEFSLVGEIELPQKKVFHMQDCSYELEEFVKIQHNFRRQNIQQKAYSAAAFNRLLHGWLSQISTLEQKSAYKETVDSIIEKMYGRLCDAWSVREMAEEANMGEQNFRKVFIKLTGQSPKKFYDALRMNMADALLRKGNTTVGKVAETMKFTDAFHFSKAFKKYYNISPSKIKAQLSR